MAALRQVFRAEIGATVRTASTLLLALGDLERRPLDELAWLIRPALGWPDPNRTFGDQSEIAWDRHSLRHHLAAGGNGVAGPLWVAGGCHGVKIVTAAADGLYVHVQGHSLEIAGALGAVRLATSHGVLRLGYDGLLPETLRIAAIGRPIGDVIDHPVLRGRRWIVEAIEPAAGSRGWVFVVRTGTKPFRMPWAA